MIRPTHISYVHLIYQSRYDHRLPVVKCISKASAMCCLLHLVMYLVTYRLRCCGPQARRIWSNVVRRLGPPDRAAANWTINVYKAIDRAICGAPCADLKKMPLGKKFASLIERYASLQSNGECLSDAQVRRLYSCRYVYTWQGRIQKG